MQMLVTIALALAGVSLVSLMWLGANASRRSTAWGMFVLLLSPPGALIYGIRHWKLARFPFMAFTTSLLSTVAMAGYLLHTSGTWEVMHTSMYMHRAVQSKDLSDRDALSFPQVSLNEITRVTPLERQQRKLQMMEKFIEKYEPSFTEEDREEINLAISRLMYGTTVTAQQKQQFVELQRRVANVPMPEKADHKEAVEETPASSMDMFTRDSRREPHRSSYRLEFLPISAAEAGNYVGKMFMVKRRDGIEKQYKLVGSAPGALRFERRIPGGRYSFEYKYRDIEQLRILAQVVY